MSYVVTQDGTQAFGIPDSPVTIGSTTYILNSFVPSAGSTIVYIKDENGVPTGKVIIPENPTGTCQLQMADLSTPVPQVGDSFDTGGTTWDIATVSPAKQQGAYTYIDVTLAMRINP